MRSYIRRHKKLPCTFQKQVRFRPKLKLSSVIQSRVIDDSRIIITRVSTAFSNKKDRQEEDEDERFLKRRSGGGCYSYRVGGVSFSR